MKNYLVVLVAVLCTLSSFAQNVGRIPHPTPTTSEIRRSTHPNAPTFPASNRQGNNFQQPTAPQFANDIIINNAPTQDQRRVRLSIAFNGWVYAAYNVIDPANNAIGLNIQMSRDSGTTWQMIDQILSPNIGYTKFDIVVAGTDTNNLKLFVAAVNYSFIANDNVFLVFNYNATTTAPIANVYVGPDHGANTINDVAITSDYRFPSFGSNPYSVAAAYTVFGAAADTIKFVASDDGGNNWNIEQNVQTTVNYSRNLSLAHGISPTASNGRYFLAWEELNSQNDRTGSIYTARNIASFNGVWTTPIQLDTALDVNGLCRNPTIATSFGNTDNDSGSVTAVVAFERDFNGLGTDFDILSMVNMRGHAGDYWFSSDISNVGTNDMHPNIVYDPIYTAFVTTYYDSTNTKLPLSAVGLNVVGWSNFNTGYNDLSIPLKAAWPRIVTHHTHGLIETAWIAEGASARGIAMFDRESAVPSGIPTNDETLNAIEVSPNPANTATSISFSLVHSTQVTLVVYNLVGEEMIHTTAMHQAGNAKETLNVQNLPAGIYFIQLQTSQQTVTKQLVVTH
jgi:hypothetical protein